MNPMFSPHASMHDLYLLKQRLAALSAARSQSIAEILQRLDWYEARFAAIEAALGLMPPPMPEPNAVTATEEDVLSAIERLEQESPDPKPLENQ